jgi:N-acetylgalactosamine-N,N'-diacetylbacillosaminyl-diphospho-undecaprenol 4-alpha-N-acetylgalactosaminyltransferase
VSEPPHLATLPRVAFFIYALGRGGAARAVLNYTTRLRRHQPLLITLRASQGLADFLPPTVPMIQLTAPGSGGARPSQHLPNQCFRLRSLLREQGITTLCSFLLRPNLLAVLTKLLMPELRVVINVHEHVTGSARYFHPRPLDRLLMLQATRHLYSHADRIVCVADFQKHDLVTNFSLPPEKIQTIPNPIDLDAIAKLNVTPRSAPLEDGPEPLILGVGSLRNLKGFDLLIRAFAGLPNLDARLLILGEGPCRGDLERLTDELGVAGRVAMAGFDPRPFPYFRRARMLVLPSHTEAFPNVIGEALAIGCPVVATDCSDGVRQYLENGRCGLLVKPNDVDALRNGIRLMLEDTDLRLRLAEEGRRRVREFDLPIIVERYERMLESLP